MNRLTSNGTPVTRAEWLDRHRGLTEFERVGYIGLGEQYNRCLYRLRRRHFMRLAGRYRVNRAERVLDVGSGSGFYLDLYHRLGVPNIHGIDISPDSIAWCGRRLANANLKVVDISKGLPAEWPSDGGFDWVGAMDVLFHIVEDDRFESALAACARAVRSGGHLAISDNFPNRRQPSDAHQAFRTMSDYKSVLGSMGFSCVEVTPVFILSNGQVGDDNAAYKAMSLYWRTFARGLGKLLRTWRVGGETAGWIAGNALTLFDAVLQQSGLRGYSTKVAIFRKD